MKDFYTKVTREDMLMRNAFSDKYLKDPAAFPISFTYGGKAYHGMPADASVEKRFVDANIVETQICGAVEDLKIKAVCEEYRDYPVVEWTVYFSAAGAETKLVEDACAIDALFEGKNGLLVHNNGDFYSAEGYTEGRTALPDGAAFEQAPVGGRPCDHAFPYQRLLFDGGGVNIAIGWPAQWFCAYAGEKDGVRLRAGQQVVHTVIREGETMRTPRMTLQFFAGAEDRGINVWRRWYNAHVMPRKLGEPVGATISFSDNGGGREFQEATEEQQLESIRKVSQNFKAANLWWIDAGWYPCRDPKSGERDWTLTGSWYPDPERFPNGFVTIGQACEKAGMELLVWFEPERIRPGLKLAVEHPEWMLKRKDSEVENMLLDLTNPDCFKWLCETLANLFKENGIKCYRQDFNFEPLLHWRDNEADDRKGMLENLYVQAYLGFWDYLLLNVPGLWIDSCASGGRRNDMETMRRSVPLHPTDYGYGYHHINQAFRHTLFSWIPYTRSWNQSWDKNNEYYSHEDYYAKDEPAITNFQFVNAMGALTGGVSINDMKAFPEKIPYVDKMLDIASRFSDMLINGDFYPLTENHRTNKQWTVFQFDWPEHDCGALQVLRNNQAADDSITVYPRQLSGEYEFTNSETGESFSVKDPSSAGIGFSLPVRAGAIWFYNKK